MLSKVGASLVAGPKLVHISRLHGDPEFNLVSRFPEVRGIGVAFGFFAAHIVDSRSNSRARSAAELIARIDDVIEALASQPGSSLLYCMTMSDPSPSREAWQIPVKIQQPVRRLIARSSRAGNR